MKTNERCQWELSHREEENKEVEKPIVSGVEVVAPPRLITAGQLYDVFGTGTRSRCERFAPYLNDYMLAFSITSSQRLCAFLATIGVESGRLRYTEELGSDSYFAKYDAGTQIGKKLGNTEKGDGARFKGRGLIQITGRRNYTSVAIAMGIDCLHAPELLSQLPYSVSTACWWWRENGLNKIADTEDLKAIRKRVNGGLNGFSEFVALYNKAKRVF